MYPPIWSFLAALLLLVGVYEIWQTPRRRVTRLLNLADELRQGRTPREDNLARRLFRWFHLRLHPWFPTAVIATLRDELLWAGHPFGLSAEEFITLKIAAGMGTGLLLLGTTQRMPFVFLGMALGYLVPDRWLARRIDDRTRQIKRDLAGFVHLFATAMEAGLPVVDAARRVAAEMPGLLAAEVIRTAQEMAAGKPSVQAWQHLGRRTKCDELQAVVTAIIQSHEMGVPVAEQLRFQITTIRTKKQQAAKERADAASVQMRVPTILLIMFPTMVILMGPALVAVLRTLRGM